MTHSVSDATGNAAAAAAAAAVSNAKTYLLEYAYVENMSERRNPFRAEHLSLAQKYIADKKLISGGPFLPAVDGALFIFRGDETTVEQFVQEDPYYRNGLIPRYSIREWAISVGNSKL